MFQNITKIIHKMPEKLRFYIDSCNVFRNSVSFPKGRPVSDL